MHLAASRLRCAIDDSPTKYNIAAQTKSRQLTSRPSVVMEHAAILEFLQTVDTSRPDWRNEIADFVLEHFVPKPAAAKFNVGEADTPSTGSFENLTIATNPAEAEANPVDDATAEDSEVPQITPLYLCATDELVTRYNNNEDLQDGEYLRLLIEAQVKPRELEKKISDRLRVIRITRAFYTKCDSRILAKLPYKHFNYSQVDNVCCENVIGYVTIPLGVAGPLRVNREDFYIPMATTEGALVASISRGCSALYKARGTTAIVTDDKMTRAPVVKFDNIIEAVEVTEYLLSPKNFQKMKKQFDSTSKFARLKQIFPVIDGCYLIIKFYATTGDAMGMNMVSKGCDRAMKFLKTQFPRMSIKALSGNYCTDKKAAAVNFIEGRGKSVVVEAEIPESVVKSVLKTTPSAMVAAAIAKLYVGSSRAVTIGGQNCHAANAVAAMFLGTGQDIAQVISSSMCSTRAEVSPSGGLYITVYMPVLEIGTVGGGTQLDSQSACLKLLRCFGPSANVPGENARKLSTIIASTVLAGEISLLAALVNDELVRSHMALNRSQVNLLTPSTSAPPEITAEEAEQNRRVVQHFERLNNCVNIL